ncbi:von Willebrand factor A domain-containing protein 1-like [Protopterus annectens]|uniref:von Willebrand factor A domain-containing protein 1-like n=1 Tax=Protopterus annectens TaxID=7888 RepID=UPI001CF997B9|nr:von Willebrand factor A domain-containing protein 1-like [Protopterus annectens]
MASGIWVNEWEKKPRTLEMYRHLEGRKDIWSSSCQMSDVAVDILFLVDSSGSITTYEFTKIRELVEKLVNTFDVGLQRVLVSLVFISSNPILSFHFREYLTTSELRRAVTQLEQQFGDTNSGKAFTFAQDHVFTPEGGSRMDVPKLVVWITDGFSTDDVIQPSHLLKEKGVQILAVSTGRTSYGLREAVSTPDEEFLFFTEMDNLPLISNQLCTAIFDAVSPRKITVSEVTARSFRLTWPRLSSRGDRHYIVDGQPVGTTKTRQGFRETFSLNIRTTVVERLSPSTTYEVTVLTSDSQRALWIKVTTLEDTKMASFHNSTASGQNRQIKWPQKTSTEGDHNALIQGQTDKLKATEGSWTLHTVVPGDPTSRTTYKTPVPTSGVLRDLRQGMKTLEDSRMRQKGNEELDAVPNEGQLQVATTGVQITETSSSGLSENVLLKI